jgi:hypothetical protein
MQVANFWTTYQQRLETDPVPTKALTSFLGFVIGDFLAQKIEGDPYDIIRSDVVIPRIFLRRGRLRRLHTVHCQKKPPNLALNI